MTYDQIEAKYDRRLREAIAQLWASIADSIPMRDAAAMIEAGDLGGAMELVGRVDQQLAATMGPIIEQAVAESGRIVAQILPVGAVVAANGFAMTDPVTAAYLREYTGRKVVEIGDETMRAIQQAVTFGVNTGRPPAAVARDMRAAVGLNSRQEEAIRNFRLALETDPAKALAYELRDHRYDGTLARGAPLTKAQIDAMVERYTAGQIRYRTQMIARTEALTAVTIGQQEAIRQGVRDGWISEQLDDGRQLRQFWIFTHDTRTREAHRGVPAMNPGGVAAGEPFKTPLGPMLHPRDPNGRAENVINCRCRTRWKLV